MASGDMSPVATGDNCLVAKGDASLVTARVISLIAARMSKSVRIFKSGLVVWPEIQLGHVYR